MEYMVMLALIIVALIGTIGLLGSTTLGIFEDDVAKITSALNGS